MIYGYIEEKANRDAEGVVPYNIKKSVIKYYSNAN